MSKTGREVEKNDASWADKSGDAKVQRAFPTGPATRSPVSPFLGDRGGAEPKQETGG
jgi:hypothetical protein